MTEPQDTALIKDAQKGDSRAFEALAGRYYETMYKFAFTYCRNQSDAQDITQDACINLARGLHTYRHDCAFTSWLYRLVINAAKDYHRRQNRHAARAGDDQALESLPASSTTDAGVMASDVLKAIDALPEGEKNAILLVFVEGLSHKQAGEVLECSESTVSWRIHEARKKLAAFSGKEQKYG